MSEQPDVKYFVFDTESVADGNLVAAIRYPGEGLSSAEAVARYRAELLQKYDNEFIPYTFQVPVAAAIGKVDHDYRLFELVTLDEPQYRPHVITEHFWRGWRKYGHPTLVSFNGRSFDIPLLELAAFRYGVPVPDWYGQNLKTREQYRNRYNQNSHLDLQELLTNFGASRFFGGLNLVAQLIGKPGKMDIDGNKVQELYESGQVAAINDYCRCDVLDTYFVFLRSAVLQGQLSLEREQALVEQTRNWLAEQSAQRPVYGRYLQQWGEWNNPWEQGERPLLDRPAAVVPSAS